MTEICRKFGRTLNLFWHKEICTDNNIHDFSPKFMLESSGFGLEKTFSWMKPSSMYLISGGHVC
jgi:hypothetical protein